MLNEIYEDWENLGEMTPEFANHVFQNLDGIMEDGISQIDSLAQQGKNEEAFLSNLMLTSIVNSATTKQPRIIKRLNKWIGRLKVALQSLGKSSRADQISISVGLPAGISVGLAWNI